MSTTYSRTRNNVLINSGPTPIGSNANDPIGFIRQNETPNYDWANGIVNNDPTNPILPNDIYGYIHSSGTNLYMITRRRELPNGTITLDSIRIG